ncbi:MAG: hypothetical protein HY282_11740 [Nitrospirae bacterium]|nr:hypothetical protein [Candidatus Manganitrophaceae bacterium]
MGRNKKKDPVRFNYYLIAFIDILNQKESLQKFKRLPVTADEKETFSQVIRETFGVVDGFRTSFEKFFSEKVKSTIPMEMIPEEHRQMFIEARKTEVKFQGFSDTIVVYVSLNDETIKAPINGVFAALAACASTFLISLAIGHVCRGGIEIGWASEFYEGEIYGSALLDAYHLESEVAQYPRIVIGDQVINYLMSMKRAEGSDPLTKIGSQMADFCLSLFARDVDGNLILDYLGEGFKKHMAPNGFVGDFKDIPKKAYKFAEKELEKWREARNTKLSIRYNLLLNYLNARLPLWEDNNGPKSEASKS